MYRGWQKGPIWGVSFLRWAEQIRPAHCKDWVGTRGGTQPLLLWGTSKGDISKYRHASFSRSYVFNSITGEPCLYLMIWGSLFDTYKEVFICQSVCKLFIWSCSDALPGCRYCTTSETGRGFFEAVPLGSWVIDSGNDRVWTRGHCHR